MSQLMRLWQTLEALPGLAAPTLEWRERLKKEYDQMGKLLRPTSELATSVDCPSPGGEGCPRRVVDHGGGRFVAVCGDTPRNCDDLPLTKPDLVIHRIDEAVLCKGIATALGLSVPTATGTGQPGILHVGDFEPIAGRRFPVYLAIQLEQEALEPLAVRLWGVASTSFILLTPTRRAVDVGLAEKMAGWKAQTAALADLLEGSGTAFAATDAARTLLAEFRAAVLPAEEAKAGMRFPTPAGATWGDVTIKFLDGHRVRVACRGESGVFNFTDMGFSGRKNAEPDVQWHLLQVLALEHGQIGWRSGSADSKNKKRKQTLNERLAAFFGIDGEAITWDKEAGVYRCHFTLLPEGNEVSASVAARQQQANRAVPSQRRSIR
jgi:hypothetical protein